MQLMETMDPASLAQLCILVCYVCNKHLKDKFLFCETLSTKTTAREIFDKVDRFFEVHGIKWEYVIGVYTDGAPATLGCHSGLLKKKFPDVIGTHCTIYCKALMIQSMPDELKSVLNDVIKAVNLIKQTHLTPACLLIYAKKVIPNSKLFYCTSI